MICLGPDVEAPPRVKAREMCPAPGQMWYDTLKNAMLAGWRLAGIHGEGSQAIRAFIQMTEDVMKEKGLTVQDVRNLRMTMNGAASRLWHKYLKEEEFVSFQLGSTLTFQF